MANNKRFTPPSKRVERKHHWLFSARVVFTTGESDGATTLGINLTLTNTKPFVTANMIGKAQQTVQAQTFEKVGDPQLRFVNVEIVGINYLGEMSAEEFYTAPPAEAAPVADEAPVARDPNDPFQQAH